MTVCYAKMPVSGASVGVRRGAAPLGLPSHLPRKSTMRVVAAAGSGSNPSEPNLPPVTPGTPGTPPVYLRGPPPGTEPPSPYSGSGGGVGGSGGGNRPVGTGGSGGGSGSGGDPRGWDMSKVLLVGAGVALAIPAWRYLNRRYVFKPEPEHTLTRVEDTAANLKHRNPVSKAASAVKHATIDPVRDTFASGAAAIKHSDTARTVQHKGEDAKDTADVAFHDVGNKAERGFGKAKKEAKHAYEDAKSKGEDFATKADNAAYEASVRGGRTVQHAKDAASDKAYDAERATVKGTHGVLEGIKGAATTVGRKLHVVADATEKGIKKAANRAEHATGTRYTTPATSTTERKRAAYIASGVVLGVGTLTALYLWDRKGGDIGHKVRKLQDRTKEAADRTMGKARDALNRNANEPAGPATNGTSGISGPRK